MTKRTTRPETTGVTYCRFADEQNELLRLCAEIDRRSVAEVIRIAVEQYLAKRKLDYDG